jgi:hypothetical protein
MLPDAEQVDPEEARFLALVIHGRRGFHDPTFCDLCPPPRAEGPFNEQSSGLPSRRRRLTAAVERRIFRRPRPETMKTGKWKG